MTSQLSEAVARGDESAGFNLRESPECAAPLDCVTPSATGLRLEVTTFVPPEEVFANGFEPLPGVR